MYHAKDDYRSIRSTEMIYEGLASLIHQKEFYTITVTNLVSAAKVGRTTFYRNFDTIEDVLRMRCDQVADGLVPYIQKFRQENQENPRSTILKPILYYFQMHSDLVELLIKAERVYILEDAIHRCFKPFRPLLGVFFQLEEEYLDYVLVARVNGMVKVLTHWIATGMKQPPDELADKLSVIVSDTIALDMMT